MLLNVDKTELVLFRSKKTEKLKIWILEKVGKK